MIRTLYDACPICSRPVRAYHRCPKKVLREIERKRQKREPDRPRGPSYSQRLRDGFSILR